MRSIALKKHLKFAPRDEPLHSRVVVTSAGP